METFTIKGEYIQLNQLLKAMGWCSNGADANAAIDGSLVKVNDVVELRKRNKIMKGFKVEFNGQIIIISWTKPLHSHIIKAARKPEKVAGAEPDCAEADNLFLSRTCGIISEACAERSRRVSRQKKKKNIKIYDFKKSTT